MPTKDNRILIRFSDFEIDLLSGIAEKLHLKQTEALRQAVRLTAAGLGLFPALARSLLLMSGHQPNSDASDQDHVLIGTDQVESMP